MQPNNKKAQTTDFWSQYRCPTGVEGKTVAEKMNKGHFDLTGWGLSHVQVKPSFVVLDVGCGGGRTLSRLARRASLGKVYGIDYSKDMVRYATDFNSNLVTQNRVEVVEGTVDKICFKDAVFDLVTAVETYYFWPNVAEAFKEIGRVLKPNGSLLVINEMILDGVYEIQNAEMIAKTQVKLLHLEEIQRVLHSSCFNQVRSYRKRKSAWNTIVAQKQ
jgi:ubiquinone/menaquinone biosynthesis C-methylase UbiE